MPRARSEAARREVVEATAALIAERGVDNLTIEDVAARSGVAKTTIYRHWPSRSALVADAVRSCWAHLAVPDTGSLRGDLLAVFEHMVRLDLADTAGRILPSVLAAAGRDPELDRLTRDLMEERSRPVRHIVERAVARGELPAEVDPELALAAIVGPLLFRKVHQRLPLTQEFLAACLDVAVAGLRAVSAAAATAAP